jgi:site-specific DNA-methyltransferase (adenine-specific)
MDADDYEKLSKGVDQIRQRGGVMDNSWKNSSDLSGANPANPLGRWPANFIHDGSQQVLDLFPNTKGGSWVRTDGARHFNNDGKPTGYVRSGQADSSMGSAARFYYCSKANKSDRNEGLDDFEEDYNRGTGTHHNGTSNTRVGNQAERAAGITHVELQKVKNVHPTVKPTDLMRYLCRLVTQPGGTVLDPFMGSGTTGKAAMLDGFDFIGCEMDEQYYKIAETRIRHALER